MLISLISSGSQNLTVLNPVLFKPSRVASSTTAAPAASTTAATSASSTSSTSATTSGTGGHSSGGGGASSTSAQSSITAYSTTVGGKQYSGSVQESDGEYVASVPSLSGATASGSSVAAAENSLSVRINEIV